MNKRVWPFVFFLSLVLSLPILSGPIAVGQEKVFVCGGSDVWCYSLNNLPRDGKFSEFSSVPIKSVAIGFRSNLMLDESGNVWQGRDSFYEIMQTITHPVTVIASRDCTFMAIDSEGTIWTWGDDRDGQLGQGNNLQLQLPPTPIDSEEYFTKIAAGPCHAMAIDKQGRLWTWGNGIYGKLGHGTTDSCFSPTLVDTDQVFTAVDVGGQHSIALDDQGRLWTWGNNQYGELGTGDNRERMSPTLIELPEYVVVIAAGFYHNLAIDSNGEVWAWGKGSDGQLGQGQDLQHKNLPTKIPNFSQYPILALSAGMELSFFVDKKGAIWECGNEQKFNVFREQRPDDFVLEHQIRCISSPNSVRLPEGSSMKSARK